MKIREIIETMRGPNYDAVAQQYGEMNSTRWKEKGEYIADLEQFKVVQYGIYYSLWDNSTLIAYCSLSNANNEVDDVWVSEAYRGQKIFSKMLWFFKTRLNKSPLRLGSVHSVTMQEVVKGLSRFKKYWTSIKTNEVSPFSIDTLDDFYSYGGSTEWRLTLENASEFSWPMFNGAGFVKESYSGYVD